MSTQTEAPEVKAKESKSEGSRLWTNAKSAAECGLNITIALGTVAVFVAGAIAVTNLIFDKKE